MVDIDERHSEQRRDTLARFIHLGFDFGLAGVA